MDKTGNMIEIVLKNPDISDSKVKRTIEKVVDAEESDKQSDTDDPDPPAIDADPIDPSEPGLVEIPGSVSSRTTVDTEEEEDTANNDGEPATNPTLNR